MTADGASGAAVPERPTDATDPKSVVGPPSPSVEIGVLAPPSPKECVAYAEDVAAKLRRMGPDRFRITVLPPSGSEAADGTDTRPPVHVLVCCLSQAVAAGPSSGGAFPFAEAKRSVDAARAEGRPVLVLTDLDLDRTLSDRRIFYSALDAGGLGSLLPRRECAERRGGGAASSAAAVVSDRRDLVEVNGAALLKPVLERPVDPADSEVRIYYPRSEGGGCKVVSYDESGRKTASFLPDAGIKVRGGGGYIYEELLLADERRAEEEKEAERERRYRKRNRLRDAASLIVPEGLLLRRGGEGDGSGAASVSYYDDEEVTFESDLSRPNRRIWIVTTAALPWMTGTAVNPLLRAAYLTRGRPPGAVTLVIPWLERAEDRRKVYGTNEFADEVEQEKYIREWLRDKAGMVEEADEETGLQLLFYPSRYHAQLGSIFAMGDTCKLIPDEDADVCVLEEPEHLNWFRAAGDAWTKKFRFVVGIVHTNYKAYASAHYTGVISAPIISGMSTLMVRAYCHKVIKLSAVLQTFAPEKEVVSNVHGVRSEFLREGERRAKALREKRGGEEGIGADERTDEDDDDKDGACVYFIGKILWAKGLDRLLHLEEFYRDCTGNYFEIDIYGDGPEITEIRRAYHGRSGGKKRRAAARLIGKLAGGGESAPPAEGGGGGPADGSGRSDGPDDPAVEGGGAGPSGSGADVGSPAAGGGELKKKASGGIELPVSMHQLRMNPIPARFLGRKDHAMITEQYKVIVNPSITEVLCTTTAEALAMGKFAIIPVHPSNAFFMQFPNCLAFRNKLEFAANLQWALTHDPEPLTEELAYQFTWEAATERFIRASAVTMREGRERAKAKKSRLDERIAYFHNRLGGGQGGDVLRTVLGAGPVSGQTKYEMARQRANSFASDAPMDFERMEGETKKRHERFVVLAAMTVLVVYVLVIFWHAFDWSSLVSTEEL